MHSLREIWFAIDGQLPFSARFKGWSKSDFVVIIGWGIHPDRFDPFKVINKKKPVGISLTDGKPNNYFTNYSQYIQNSIIPLCDKPCWHLEVNFDLSLYQAKQVYGLKNVLQFGLYKGKIINDIITKDLPYIFFCIKEGYLTLSHDAIQTICDLHFNQIDNQAVLINNYRLNQLSASPESNINKEIVIQGVQSKMNYPY